VKLEARASYRIDHTALPVLAIRFRNCFNFKEYWRTDLEDPMALHQGNGAQKAELFA